MAEMDQPPSPWENLDGDELLELARAAGIDVAELQADTSITGVLEATDSITDASGDTHTGELADRDGDDLTPNTIDFATSITDAEGNTVTSLSDPVRVTEEASTFAESDVTVSGSAISENDSLGIPGSLISNFENGDISTNAPWSGWSGDTGSFFASTDSLLGTYSGNLSVYNDKATISVSRSQYQPSAVSVDVSIDTVGGSGDDTKIALLDNGGEVMAVEFDPYSQNISVGGSWETNTHYRVFFQDINFNEETYTARVEDIDAGNTVVESTGRPISNSGSHITSIELEQNSSISGQTITATFDRIYGQVPQSSSTALIEWDSGVPADINSWDLATFQTTEDGETVTVDVEDEDGNVLFTDIGPDFDISTIDNSKNVKLRANLSRNNTTNNPTLDYAARRFTR